MWFKIQRQQVILQIIAKPHAKRTAVVKITEEALHIALHAKPCEGAANKALISFLSEIFALPKSSIILKTGARSKYKQVLLPLNDAVRQLLEGLSEGSAQDY